ncbi:MAG: alpha-ketoglutarate-dependent dioxygenase AlkB [Caulobacteraceae bacterium]
MSEGFLYHPDALARPEQDALARAVFAAAEGAPFFQPVTPSGRPMSVRMTGFGPLSWITDAKGYRYAPRHPGTGRPWPPMPQILLALWRRHCPGAPEPDACLANLYREGARMGLHQDKDERDFDAPVLSLSLGDTARLCRADCRSAWTPHRARFPAGLSESGGAAVVHGHDACSSRSRPKGERGLRGDALPGAEDGGGGRPAGPEELGRVPGQRQTPYRPC